MAIAVLNSIILGFANIQMYSAIDYNALYTDQNVVQKVREKLDFKRLFSFGDFSLILKQLKTMAAFITKSDAEVSIYENIKYHIYVPVS